MFGNGHEDNAGCAGSSRGGESGSSRRRSRVSNEYGNVESWATTRLKQEECRFQWTLSNFSVFSGSTLGEAKSPFFRGGHRSRHLWQLTIHPRRDVEGEEFMSIHLALVAFGDECYPGKLINARFELCLLDTDERPFNLAGGPNMPPCQFGLNSYWGYQKFISLRTLRAPCRRLLVNDTVKVLCKIWIEGVVAHKVGTSCGTKPTPPLENRANKGKERLATDLGELLKTNNAADFTINTKTQSHPAHKAILAARSSVFAAMISTDMEEKKTNAVQIPDFSDEAVKAMLKYMYTAEIQTDQVPQLLEMAEKYDMEELKKECEYVLGDCLTVDNAASVLALAHIHNADILKEKAIQYVNANKDDIVKTKTFQDVAKNYPAVIVELYLG